VEATWYFDVVSPYAYLALGEIEELGRTIPITHKPVLFAGLLKHYGHLGPAEIPSKRIHTYRLCIFEAERRGIELRFPPVHPFNPLRALRVLCALGAEPGAVRRVMDYVWREGHDPNEDGAWEELCRDLGIDRPDRQGDDAAAKAALRGNTEEAIAQGVFGVPTLVIGRELFWGCRCAAARTGLPLRFGSVPNWKDGVRRYYREPVGSISAASDRRCGAMRPMEFEPHRPDGGDLMIRFVRRVS
jgi:2-hydroxychromene-2-carboxylate isomerase